MEDTASVADSAADSAVDIPDSGSSAPDSGSDAPTPSASEEVDADTLLANAAEEYDRGKGKPATEAKPAAETKGSEEKPAEGDEEPTDRPYEAPVETEELKKAWKSLQRNHPDTYRAIRDSWFKTKAYEENFTVPEVREIRQLFESPQAAREARQAQADLMTADQALHERPVDLLQYIAKASPEGFEKLASSLPQTFYAMNPQLYRERVSEPAVKHYHEFFENYAQQTNDEDLKAAIEIIRDRDVRWRNNGGRQIQQQGFRQPGDPVMQRLQELEQLNARQEAQVTQSFKGSVDSDFQSSLASEIGKIIERSGADLSDAGRQEIVNRTMDDVIDRILEDPVLQRQLSWATRQGTPRDQTSSKHLVDRLMANAKRFLGPTAATHLKWLTEQVVSTNQKRLNQQSRVSPHTEVRGALPNTPSGGRLTKTQIAKMSDDDIMEAAAKGLLD